MDCIHCPPTLCPLQQNSNEALLRYARAQLRRTSPGEAETVY